MTNELHPSPARGMTGLLMASWCARRLLNDKPLSPQEAHCGGQELVARRAGARIIRKVSGQPPEGLSATTFEGSIDAFAAAIVDDAVSHYSAVVHANLGDPAFMEAAVDAELQYERFAQADTPIRSLLKKIAYAGSKRRALEEKLQERVGSSVDSSVKDAVREGANTVFALFEVVPHVIRRAYPDIDNEQALKMTEAVAHTVPRFALEWSGLSKADDARAVRTLRRNPPKSQADGYTDLRFDPDKFTILECPKTQRPALGIVTGVLASETQEVRYGCPAYEKGGITRLCRVIEVAVIGSGMYEFQINELYGSGDIPE